MRGVGRTLRVFAVMTAVLMIAAPVLANRGSLEGEIFEFLADGEKIPGFITFNWHTNPHSEATLGKIITRPDCELFNKHYRNNTTFQLIVIYQLEEGGHIMARFDNCAITDIGYNGKGAARYSFETPWPVVIEPLPW